MNYAVMKVLMQSRVSIFSSPGGDTIQILKTKEYLEKSGVHVDISTELEPDVSMYDIVHIFNVTRPQEAYLQARNAKSQKKKVVLSPIYVDYSEYEKVDRPGIGRLLSSVLDKFQMEYCKMLGRVVKSNEVNKGTLIVLQKGFRKVQTELLKFVDMLLPNSHSELSRLGKDFSISQIPFMVIPNAVDSKLFNREKTEKQHEFSQFNGCILCVARIDGIKNQFRLVQALKDFRAKLVFAGKISQHHQKDFQKIKDMNRPDTYFLGNVSHDKLPSLYAAAKVHVLPSFFETTGLSSLEAGIMGCNVVVSDRGDVREYFGDMAVYCEPGSVSSIYGAVSRAYASKENPALRMHISKNFTWEITADKTLSAYEYCRRNH